MNIVRMNIFDVMSDMFKAMKIYSNINVTKLYRY
jgi:hypothetical protein